jgi:hypothetical protein
MENEEKKIIVGGKEIDYSNFSDEKLLLLYDQLLKRQEALTQRYEEIKNSK